MTHIMRKSGFSCDFVTKTRQTTTIWHNTHQV